MPCARRPLPRWLCVGALVLVLAIALPAAVVDALQVSGAAAVDGSLDGPPPLAVPPPPIVLASIAWVVTVVALATIVRRSAPASARLRLRAPPTLRPA